MGEQKKERVRLFNLKQKKRQQERRAAQCAKSEKHKSYEADTVVDLIELNTSPPPTFFSKGIEFGLFGAKE